MKFISLTSILILTLLCSCVFNDESASSELPSPAGDNSMYPRLFTDNTGTVFMSWLEQSESGTFLKFASYSDKRWSKPQTIAADSGWFVNWADFPSIIAKDGKQMAAHWLNKVEGGTYAYEINMSVFDSVWSEPFTPHEDGTATEHGFVSMTPASDTTFFATWLDGRNTENRSDSEYGDIQKAMTLRAALIHKSGKILEKYLLDESVCDCCNTAVTKTENGFLIAYRNRTEDEIRDIYTVSIIDGKVSKPQLVHADNWEIAACPVNGPAISSEGNVAALSWFTANNGEPKVRLAISRDGGIKFGTPLLIDAVKPTGRVDLEINDNSIWVSWLSTEDERDVLKITSYSFQGEKLIEYTIEGVSKDRNAGFPQIATYKEGLLVATTYITNGKSSVVVRQIN